MLLAALVLALTPDAHACSPGPAEIVAQAPANGQQGVPVDAVIRLVLDDGYVWSAVAVEVSVDGEPIPGEVSMWTHTKDLTEQTGLLTFTPAEDLPADAEVEVRVDGVGVGPEISVFRTGDARLGSEAPAAPELMWVEATDGEVPRRQQSSCDTDTWRDVYLSGDRAPADPHALGFVVAYRLDRDRAVDLSQPVAVSGPLEEGGAFDLNTTLSWDIDRHLTEECFVVVAYDGAGNASAPSEVMCASEMMMFECGTGLGLFGCSTAPLGAVLGPALLAMLGVGVRRREED